jgi:dihydrofolate synthase / folylpolyglutamate synthase
MFTKPSRLIVMKKKMSYEEAVQYLYGLQKYGIKFGLSKTSNLLKAFGNPHRGRAYIHIGGTNGKGSVAAMVESILIHSGFKVGFYCSPHLLRFTERFRVNGAEISPEDVARLVSEVQRRLAPGEPPTFFEFTTAMGLIHFAREQADISILEVGMGGRLDATNVIRPKVCVITNISLDHQGFLGSRIIDIAGEKAGIIKRGIDVVTAATQPAVLRLFGNVCRDRGAPLWRLGREIRTRIGDSTFNYYGLDQVLRGLDLALFGRHQYANAALALGATEVLRRKGFRISEEDMREGLKNARWPGRLHTVSWNPRVVLDGAHNPAAMKSLIRSITREVNSGRLIVVLGIMADKDIPQIIRAVVPAADYVICTRPEYYRAAPPETLMKAALPLRKGGEVSPTLPEALKRARDVAESNDLILVTGSLFTVGEAMACLDPGAYRPDKIR